MRRTGTFTVESRTVIAVDSTETARIGAVLARWLRVDPKNVRVLPRGAELPPKSIVLWLDGSSDESPRDPAQDVPSDKTEEAFTLDVDEERILIHGTKPAGLFYGAQTIAQLAKSRPIGESASGESGSNTAATEPLRVPCVHIEDAPAFTYRGMHLDVARHFFPREVVERTIDLLAFYRFNVFHWHLTDDQGFRLAIESHPELTKTQAYYTQDDARAIVAYAKERFITVIPEIEMPGHARAILASHPELSCTGKKLEIPTTWGVFDDVLCAGNDATYKLLDDILGEVTKVFPSRMVHLGGDEVPKDRWRSCAKCRARMQKEKLSEHELQGWFMKRVSGTLEKLGRRTMAWDEALDGGLPASGVVVAWQSKERGAAAAQHDHDVVMAPNAFVYFDQPQRPERSDVHETYLPWTKVLAFDPIPDGLDARQTDRVLGAEGTLWTEHVKTREEIEARALPRMAALSEVLWSAPSAASTPGAPKRDPRTNEGIDVETDFARRFEAQRSMLDDAHVGYFIDPPTGLPSKRVFIDKTSLALAAPTLFRDGIVRFTTDGSEPTTTSRAFTPETTLPVEATTNFRARLFLPNGRTSETVSGTFERAAPLPALTGQALPAAFSPGVDYTYIEGAFERIPDFPKDERGASSAKRGRLPQLGFDVPFRNEQFAVDYRAFVNVETTGVHRFVARADDGVLVEIDGVRVIEDDGRHAARDAEGEIALAAGYHAVRIRYFQAGHGKELSLICESPSKARAPCPLVVERR